MTKSRRRQALHRQTKRLQQRIHRLEKRSERFVWLRLLLFSSGLLTSAFIFFAIANPWLAVVTLAGFLFAFGGLVAAHRRLQAAIDRHRLLLAIKSGHLARMSHDWANLPPATHQASGGLELDLDLCGDYALMRLLDVAVSRGGSQQLRTWLTAETPNLAETRQRQAQVRELIPQFRFRDRLILNGLSADAGRQRWRPQRLLAWLEQRPQLDELGPWVGLLAGLAALNAALFLADIAGGLPGYWQVTLVVYLTLTLYRTRDMGELFHEAADIRDALEQLLVVFRQLERESYRAMIAIGRLCAPFRDPTTRPSAFLGWVNRLIGGAAVRGNPLLWLLLNTLLPWDLFFAWRLGQAQKQLASYLPHWLDTWYELEALASLANFGYLNPQYVLPSLDQAGPDGPVFEAEALGHPLIPDEQRVCNDFSLNEIGELALLTGSNMSGKSTFLKTVGINLALAFAGGPVTARRLNSGPVRLYTCMRISDSVVDGVSYFYAEVRCLKGLLTALDSQHPYPVFYLIDEIFRGTNNRERLIGSQAYIRALVGQHGLGLISTHDLELVQLADQIPSLHNYHFTDQVSDGQLIFDYALRPGPSPTTNALKIMRMAGLPL